MVEQLESRESLSELPWGIVLTAGSQKKQSPSGVERIEPDLEGKMRSLSALHDLVGGRIRGILVAGGARNHGIPLARIYKSYLDRFQSHYDLEEDQIVEIKGGVSTPSDLRKTREELKNRQYLGDLVVYSSGYHFERNSINDFVFEYVIKLQRGHISLTKAEEKILERHRFYRAFKDKGLISERILTPEHVEAMRTRNQRVDRFPGFVSEIGAYLMRR